MRRALTSTFPRKIPQTTTILLFPRHIFVSVAQQLSLRDRLIFARTCRHIRKALYSSPTLWNRLCCDIPWSMLLKPNQTNRMVKVANDVLLLTHGQGKPIPLELSVAIPAPNLTTLESHEEKFLRLHIKDCSSLSLLLKPHIIQRSELRGATRSAWRRLSESLMYKPAPHMRSLTLRSPEADTRRGSATPHRQLQDADIISLLFHLPTLESLGLEFRSFSHVDSARGPFARPIPSQRLRSVALARFGIGTADLLQFFKNVPVLSFRTTRITPSFDATHLNVWPGDNDIHIWVSERQLRIDGHSYDERTFTFHIPTIHRLSDVPIGQWHPSFPISQNSAFVLQHAMSIAGFPLTWTWSKGAFSCGTQSRHNMVPDQCFRDCGGCRWCLARPARYTTGRQKLAAVAGAMGARASPTPLLAPVSKEAPFH
ncbi:hypothetical protein BKA62DRAFT_672827 [Auriculariales sp. MPI-PUGE-AT-0066]|nr:hypothetical protein BKA62DRAFT_672827 [Auriculariales sp. MPI-PUGE-AT-0066]